MQMLGRLEQPSLALRFATLMLLPLKKLEHLLELHIDRALILLIESALTLSLALILAGLFLLLSRDEEAPSPVRAGATGARP